MTPTRAAPRDDAGPGWLLLAVAVSLPWLLPVRGQPWVDFWNQALAAAVAVAVAAWVVGAGRRDAWPLPRGVVAPLVLVLAAALQASTGRLLDPGEAVLPVLYALGVAACLAIGHRAETIAPGRLADALLAGVLIAAMASTGLALAQWLRVDGLGVLSYDIVPGARPVANLGQPNLLATLLLWGLVAVWWTWHRQQVGAAVAVLVALFLALGLALTQSRSGALGAVLLAAWAALAPRGGRSPSRALLLAMVVALVGLLIGWSFVDRLMSLEAARGVGEVVQAGKRPAIWALSLDAIALRPWAGWGLGLNVLAHSELAVGRQQPLYVIVGHAHNAVLDLMVGVGAPLGLAIAGAVAWWGWTRSRAALRGGDDGCTWVLFGLLLVLAAHAMLELPHHYAQFIVPAALVAGIVDARVSAPVWRWPPIRIAVPGALAVLTAALAVLVVDYQRLAEDHLSWRMRAARIGDTTPVPPPEVHLLGALQRALLAARIEPRPAMPAAEIEALDRAARRYPSAGTLFKSAQAFALNGQPDPARDALQRLCAMHWPSQCAAAAAAWREIAATRHPAMAAVTPPAPP